MEPVMLLEGIFEAVTRGDTELFQRCVGEMTIGTVLEFERLYRESPLHLCVKRGGMENLPMVRCLLRSGFFDDASVDDDGLTILTYAYEEGPPELLIPLIEATTEGMDDATACYRILRHDSRKLFEKFLDMKQFPEEKEFQYIAGALIQLNVKKVKLSEDLHIFTLWKLSDYGFRHLSGDWPGTKDPNEWKRHVEIVLTCSEDILKHHDTKMYDDVDDLFLHRLHTLHNHLYFLKHKPCLKDLPTQELVFCLAMFLSIYRDDTNFWEYRLTINKCLVIEFVDMINRQLTMVKKILDQAEKELLVLAEKSYDYQEQMNNNDMIEDLLAKLESSQFKNKEYVVKKYREQLNTIGSSKKDGLIKELMTKIKTIDKKWAEEKMKTLQESALRREEYLIDEIAKRLCHVSHPQNVTNQFMSVLRKGRVTADIVADIISNEKFDLSHLMEADGCTKRKLIDCYTINKQYYSLQKIVYYSEQMIRPANAYSDMPCVVTDRAYMKRTLQAIGEAIKNTTNSPNLPGKALSAIDSMLTKGFSNMNKVMREVISHSVSLKKELVGNTDNFNYFQSFCSNYKPVLASFYFICILVISDMKIMLYKFMEQCSSMDHIRSLALYVGDITELDKRQVDYLRKVEKSYAEMSIEFLKWQTKENPYSPVTQLMQKRLEFNLRVIHDLGKHLHECAIFRYEDLWSACRFGNDLDTIRRMLNWKRVTTCVDIFYHHAITRKVPVEAYLNDDTNDFPMFLLSHKMYEFSLLPLISHMKCAEEFDYIEYTRELVNGLGVQDTKIKEETLCQLNEKLKPYYNDMFFLSKKWDVLKKFFKEHKLAWDEKTYKTLEDIDKQKLQKKYDEHREQLRSILEKAGLQPDLPTKRLFELSPPMLLAIECIQLELCEMLQSAGYFGDSFHCVKHRIPMLQGKNYRNFLAHDSLSYNLLTDSRSMEKVVINAFVFATREVQLFGSKRNNDVHLTFPSLTEVEQWVTKQHQLLEAFQERNVQRMHAIGKDGGEIKLARFCCSQNPTYNAAKYFHLADLVNPCHGDTSMVEYLHRYFTGFRDRCNDPAYQLAMEKKLRVFRAVFDRTIAKGDRFISEELFDWPELVEHLKTTDILNITAPVDESNEGCRFWYSIVPSITAPSMMTSILHLLDPRSHTVALHYETNIERDLQLLLLSFYKGFDRNSPDMLKMLIKHGNEQGVLELLPYLECFSDTKAIGPLREAMLCCQRSITELLLDWITVPHADVVLFAIILHWDDIFTRLIETVELNEATYLLLLKAAIKTGNYRAGDYLLKTPTLSRFIAAAFKQSALTAAHLGDAKFITSLLQASTSSTMDATTMAKILYEATLWKRWKCVEILLENRAPVHMTVDRVPYDESCTLLLLVKYGQHELLRCIASNTINRKELGTFATLPFAAMVKNEMASEQMIDALQQLGFDWLDSSHALHEAILLQNNDIVQTIFDRINAACMLPPAMHHEHFQSALGVLYRWKCISFLEESNDGCSLNYAAKNDDVKMAQKLLEQGRTLRTMPEVGVLGGIVFHWNSDYICALKGEQYWPELNIGDCCKEMIDNMKFYSQALDNWRWQQLTVAAHSIPITFYVFIEEEAILEPASHDDATLTLSKPDSLLDCLKEVQSFVGSKLSQYTFLYACYSTTSGMKHFWQIGSITCMFDVRSEPDGHIDLSDTVNCRNEKGETPLCYCTSVDMVRLLVENGANPLLAESSGITPIQGSMMSFKRGFDHAVAIYLLDECMKRNLRTEQGCSAVEMDHCNDTLLHGAVLTGRRDVIQRLIGYGADASAKNFAGQTPAQFAVAFRVYKANQIVQMLLDYDPSSINNIDFFGRTLVQTAVCFNELEILRTLLKYKPDLHTVGNKTSVLGQAVLLGQNGCAKCILEHAETHNIRGLTRPGTEYLVEWSLKYNDKELSRKLLEYEQQHPWEELTERDLPKLEVMQGFLFSNGLVTTDKSKLSGSYDFLLELSALIIKLKVMKNISK